MTGWTEDYDKVVMVQVDRGLTQRSEAYEVDMDSVVGVNYNPKYFQVCLRYRKGYGDYGEILNIGDTGSKTMYGIPNMVQKEEREAFLDYLERLRGRLQEQGYKQEKWTR